MIDNLKLSAAAFVVAAQWGLCTPAAADEKVTSSDASKSAAIVKQLLDKEQMNGTGKELLMLSVEYPPGGSSPPHRHDSQVFVYVLEGVVNMQVAGGPLLTLQAGETFYENPNDVHVVSANASRTSAAKILVFILKDKGAPVSRPASSKSTP